MSVAFFAKRVGVGVERAVELRQLALAQTELLDLLGEARRIGTFLRAKAAVTAAVVTRTKASASGMRDGTWRGVPCATITQTWPLSLHSTQTLCGEIKGLRLLRYAESTSSN